MRSKNEVLCTAAGRLAAERSEADKPAKAHNRYLYSKAAKSYFDEPREKLSSRPLCSRDKTISGSSKDFVAKVYTTFCVQPENL
jgi:hypothetical protein